MGKFYFSFDYRLGIACLAAFAFSPVANAAIERIGYDGATTSYYVQPGSIGTGPGVQVVRETGVPQIEKMPNGGLSQRMPAGVIIDAKQVKAPFSAYFRAAPSAAIAAAKRCFTSFRCNLALAAGSAGIDALLDGLDWVMGPGGKLQRHGDYFPIEYDGGSYPHEQPIQQGFTEYKPLVAGQWADNIGGSRWFIISADSTPSANGRYRFTGCPAKIIYYFLNAYSRSANLCYYGTSIPKGPLVDVTPAEIDVGFESYDPQVSDWDFIAPGFDPAVDDVSLDFDVPDSISLTGEETQIYDSTGNLVGSKGTFSTIEFSKSNAPGPRPDLSVKIKEETVTLSPEGAVTGREEKTQDINPVPGASDSGGVRVNVNVPTDCNFMPTVCRFIAWFTEPDPNPEPELSDLINDIEIEREFTVGTDTAACPAPFTIPLSWFGEVEVSLDPFCNLADALRPLLLALAFVYSGLLILRT